MIEINKYKKVSLILRKIKNLKKVLSLEIINHKNSVKQKGKLVEFKFQI
jgi:hypothetical protein